MEEVHEDDMEPERKKLKVESAETVKEEKNVDQEQNLGSSDVKKSEGDLHVDVEKGTPDVSEPETVVKAQPVGEKDVGITEYISSHEGFQGVLKQRYSDFLVSEIDLAGQVVKLTSFDIPVEEITVKVDQDVSHVLNEADIEKLKKLVETGNKADTVLIEVDDDKDKRARIHNSIKTGFTGLQSTTVTKEDKKYIEVKFSKTEAHNHRNWPKDRGDYCRFVLYKENKDTMDAVGLVAKNMRMKPALFQYAGTKDRRARTTQEVTAYRITAEKLLEVNKKLRNIATGNYRYVKKQLRLGDSKGNRFTMVLRSVTGSEEEIQAAMTSLQQVGFINFYGMQRFGTSSIPTHHIGRAMLHSRWKEAIELILKPRHGDDKEVGDARKFWWETRDSKTALDKFPKFCFIERTILQGLVTHGKNDYLAALKKVARNTQLMYIHSYQSYVWNTMVSRRIRELGLKPIVGDLVIPSQAVNSSGMISSRSRGNKPYYNSLTDNWPTLEQTNSKFSPTTNSLTRIQANRTSDASKEKIPPAMVTADTVSNYSIEDVVLPLPGYDVKYPENGTKAWYQELMAQDDLDVDNLRHKNKEYSLSGDYRHIVVQPSDVSWQAFRYDDVTIPLALSDYDRLNGVSEPESLKDGKQVALRIELTLPSSCYATMAVREVFKMDTSSAYQASLNVT